MTVSTEVDSPLATIRKAHGYSVRHTAKEARTDPSNLLRIERGDVMPTVPVLYRLAGVLGLAELRRLLEPYVPEAKR